MTRIYFVRHAQPEHDIELLTQWHKAKDLARDYNNADSADAKEKDFK